MTDKQIKEMINEVMIESHLYPYEDDASKWTYLLSIVRKYLPKESSPLGEMTISDCGVIKHGLTIEDCGMLENKDLIKRSQRGEPHGE